MREFVAVAASRHVHVGQENVDGQARLQKHESLGGIGGFDNLEACVFKKLRDE